MTTEFKSTVSSRTIKSYEIAGAGKADVVIFISSDKGAASSHFTLGRDICISAADARAFSQQLNLAAITSEVKSAEYKRKDEEKVLAEKKKAEEEKKAAEAAKPKTEVEILRTALENISKSVYCNPRHAAGDALIAAKKAAIETTPLLMVPHPYANAYLPIPNRYLVGFVD